MEEKPLGLNRELNKNEFYNLDYALAKIIYPLLVDFRNANKGYPFSIGSVESWDKTIDKMIFSFKEIAEEYPNMPDITINEGKEYKKYNRKLVKGFNLFAKYFNNLWI